jgi:predicted permease
MHLAWVGPQYFAAMKIPMRSGRDFTWQDAMNMPRVAIVNDTFARQHFGDRSALGASIGGDGAPYEIVGVVGDAKYMDLRQQVPPTVYLHAFQRDGISGQLAIRSAVNPEHLAAAVRQEIRAAAPSVVVTGVRTLARQIDASIARERLLAALSGCFAVLGLLLAAVGLHGVMAYSVSQRRNEIGIRMALGAPRSRVTRLVAGEALVMTALGAAAGAAGALWLSRGLGSLLYGLGPRDPLTLSAAVVVMLLTALVAAYVPSRRAASVDPATTLRE